MKISFKKFILKEDLKYILVWHKDMVKIDFPDSKYKKSLFIKILEKEYKKEPGGFMIVMDGPKKIGFLWLNTRYDPYRNKKYGYIHYLYLIKEYRGLGLGKDLLKKAEDYFLKKKRLKIIQLGTGAHNLAALKLYNKMKYKQKRIILEKSKN